MNTHALLCVLFITCCLTTTDQRSYRRIRSLHEPPPGTPSFLRHAVESRPSYISQKDLLALYQEEFGSKSLPLRTAVESVPDVAQSSRRLPLRDAVEKRPPPNELEVDGDSGRNTIPVKTPQHGYVQQVWRSDQPVIPLRILPLTPIQTPLRNTQFFPLQQFHNIVGLDPFRVDNTHQSLTQYRPTHRARSLYPNNPFFRQLHRLGNGLKGTYTPTSESGKRIVCFLNGQSVHRKPPLAFTVNDLETDSCTHLIYGFSLVDPETSQIVPRDESYEIIQGGYIALSQLKQKNPDLRILISVGGERDESSHGFSNLVQTSSRRRNFIKSAIQFLELYHFDGIDIHWMYPGAEGHEGAANDKTNFKYLLEELRDAFGPMNYMLTVSVPASRFKVEDGFDIETLEKTAHFVNLQAYDYHKDKEPIADHHSPLNMRPKDSGLDVFNNVDYSVNYWLTKGLSADKLILGIPFFGRSFTLQYTNDSSIGSPILGPGREGYYTEKPGFLAYYEICDKILNEGWHQESDAIGSPFIRNGDQWVGYDNVESVRRKVLYAMSKNLGGVFVSTIDLDDFKGLCGDKWPLLNTINVLLAEKKLEPDQANNCLTDGVFNNRENCASYFACRKGVAYEISCREGMLYNPIEGRCAFMDARLCRPNEEIFIEKYVGSIENILRNERLTKDKPRVVCFFTNWAFYRKDDGKFVPEQIDQSLCTHVVYAFASLNPKTLLLKEFDPWADIDNNLYERVTSLKGTTAMLSLGGWTDSSEDKYSKLVSDSGSRRKFIIGVVDFLKKYGFKGLHLDWNYPVCWQSNCKKGPASDRNNFNKLVEELKQEFDKQKPSFVLAASISGYKEVIDVAYNIPVLSKYLDFMSVMTYDYHGSWEKVTGHVSPLFGSSRDKFPQYNTNYTMNYLAELGAPRDKLLVGIPFYGQTFKLESEGRYTIGSPSIGSGQAGEYTKQPGMLAYYEICDRVRNQRWLTVRDKASGSYAYYRNQWVGYDNIESVENKAKYIKLNGFGGAVAWTIDLDDFNNRCCEGTFPLLKAINRGLSRISGPQLSDCTKPPEPVTPPAPTLTTGVDSGASSSTTPTWEWSSTTTLKPSTTPPWTTQKPITTTTSWWTTTKKPTTTSTTVATTTSWWKPETTTPTVPALGVGVTMPSVDHKPIKCTTGQYYPDEQNCNAYYFCVNGEMKKQYCAGSLHWNRERGICDWPDSAKCTPKKPLSHEEITTSKTTTITRTTTTSKPFWEISMKPTTIESTTTSKPFWETTTSHWQTKTTPSYVSPLPTTQKPIISDIDKCEPGVYYPHEECHKFYVCVNGELVSQICGSGLVWNVDQNRCDWKHATQCGDRRVKDRIKDNLIHRITYKPHSSCTAGSFAAYEGDCGQYLICLWGKYEAFQCAAGLEWNDEKKICDWPENARCSDGTSPDSVTGIETVEVAAPPGEKPPSWKPPSTQKPKPTTTSRPEIPREPLPPMSGYFKIVCYFTNWAWYRRGDGKYTPEDIDADLCTHIVYGFAVLDYENLIIKAHDSWADYDNKFYERVVAYKNKGKKVSLALGGWNDSQGDKYSRLANNPAARARFIKHALEFLEKYDFDGLDLDWEYPKCWQVDCKKGPDSDKAAFAAWTTELREAFAPKGLLLSAAVSPSKTVIDAGYDVQTIGRNLDWVAVMTYDFHGQWDKQTGHVAPMYVHPEDEVTYYNSNFSINYWIEQGVPRRKIVMGMPLYGQSFQLENAANHGLNAKAPGPGQAGEYTRAAGFLAYYEICDRVKNREWAVVQDPKRRMGPYAYNGNQWVSYDDKEMIQLKSEYIRKMDLGGGMIWALDLDDFRNRCGDGYHPLLTTIRKELAAPGTGTVEVLPTIPPEPGFVEPPLVETPEIPHEIPQSTTARPLVDKDSEYKVVCYFTNWAWYRQGVGKYLPSDIDPDLCTHIVYGFAVLNGDQGVIKPHDSWADFDNKFYEKVTAFKAKGIKVLIAIGGWNDSAGDKYSKLANNPSSRRRFIAHVVEFIESNNFDGLDLDWEYPKCWQVDCNKGPSSDKQAFADFVKELHDAFQPKGWLLSSAVSPSRRVIDAGYDVPTLSKYLDWIAVMCYDYHGQWDKVTGHVAPMYAHPDDVDDTFNTNFTIHYWIEQGADRKKLVLGMPMYGQSFSLADNSNHGLNAPTYGGGEAGEETRARGFLSYYEICTNIRKRSWTVVKDKQFRIGPYAYSRDQWVSFDDIPMIEHKSRFIKEMGLGGGMIWALDLDDFKNICGCEEYPLLKTINRVLRNYAVPAPKCQLGGTFAEEEKLTTSYTLSTPKTTIQPQWIAEDSSTGKSCKGLLFLPHESNCQQYYLCNQGELQLQSCSSGLYWNVNHCDWPENTPCHPDSTTTFPEVTEIPEETPAIVTTPKPFEPGTLPAVPIPPSEDGYKVVCYFTNWAWYRQGEGKYLPSDIDDTLCTHIAYGFAVLDPNTLTIRPHDSWADIDNEFYNRVVAYKTKGIKVLIAIGGWNDSLGDKYSRLVGNPQARAKFIANVVQFIEKWGFEGLDLDWEYPKCWQVDCNKGPDSDKSNFAQFVKELSAAFRPRGWLLSSAVSPSKMVIDNGYDVRILNDYFDWISVMTYDFHGQWDKQTGHVAPLYYYPGDVYDYFNANFTLHYWIEKGAHPRKLVMGMPLYGQSFSLADASDHGLNAKSYGPGEAGEFTRAGGFLAFYEICERVKRRSWTVIRDPQGRIGPYAYSGNQWVSYDDIAEIKRKSQLVKNLGLGGGMIWALDLDDFRNRCGCGKHPLLKMMNHQLRNLKLETNLENCT